MATMEMVSSEQRATSNEAVVKHVFNDLINLNFQTLNDDSEAIKSALQAQGLRVSNLPKSPTLIIRSLDELDQSILATLAAKAGEPEIGALTLFQRPDLNLPALMSIMDAVSEYYY